MHMGFNDFEVDCRWKVFQTLHEPPDGERQGRPGLSKTTACLLDRGTVSVGMLTTKKKLLQNMNFLGVVKYTEK